MNDTDRGSYNELRAALALMDRGYKVFRAMSPSFPCDLIALKAGKCLRVEVRTAHSDDGKLRWPWSSRDEGRSDALAAVFAHEVRFFNPGRPNTVVEIAFDTEDPEAF